jgi:hypothetical protein
MTYLLGFVQSDELFTCEMGREFKLTISYVSRASITKCAATARI